MPACGCAGHHLYLDHRRTLVINVIVRNTRQNSGLLIGGLIAASSTHQRRGAGVEAVGHHATQLLRAGCTSQPASARRASCAPAPGINLSRHTVPRLRRLRPRRVQASARGGQSSSRSSQLVSMPRFLSAGSTRGPPKDGSSNSESWAGLGPDLRLPNRHACDDGLPREPRKHAAHLHVLPSEVCVRLQ